MGWVTRLLHKVWRALGSMRLAAILLAAVLLASWLASLFPQMPAAPAAHEAWLAAVALRYGRSTSLLHTLGLFDAYRAPWFLALLAALLLNTLACTLQRWPGLWRTLFRVPAVVQPDPFYGQPQASQSQAGLLPIEQTLRCLPAAYRAAWVVPSLAAGLRVAQEMLARRRYRVRVIHGQGVAYLYAERGRWGQAATLVGHLAALAWFLALAARPALSWQEPGVVLLPGQVYPVGQHTGYPAGGLIVRAGELAVERDDSGQARGYHVPLAVSLSTLAGGEPIRDAQGRRVRLAPPLNLLWNSLWVTYTVSINHPLTVRGLSFHLQGYGPAARLATPAQTLDLAFTDDQAREVALGEADLTLRVAYRPEEGTLFVEALDAGGTLLGSGAVADGQEIAVRDVPISFTLQRYTVWQVSRDPTCGPAVAAVGLFLAATLISLWVPYRRVWLKVEGGGGSMGVWECGGGDG